MTTPRKATNGVPHPDWDGTQRPSPLKTQRMLPPVQVSVEQQSAARRYLGRVGALDLADTLGLNEAEVAGS